MSRFASTQAEREIGRLTRDLETVTNQRDKARKQRDALIKAGENLETYRHPVADEHSIHGLVHGEEEIKGVYFDIRNFRRWETALAATQAKGGGG